ncbi:MAG: dipeptide epimerase [Candidatus Omnitrophica bacterium]|nr:dipeptide epimerase [Candidatus Omnitrophota bacterium]MDD5670132.1 dipeptide epimerase [Candidatus Omnitrophota bacterium]
MIIPSIIQSAKVKRLQAKLTIPFRIALGQHDSLDNVLFEITLADGTRGYGEAAVATHITGETVEGTIHNLEKAAECFIGRDGADYLRISGEFGERLAGNPCALAALEMALLDALTCQWKMPLWRFFGPKLRMLKTDMTVVLGNVPEAETLTRAIYRRGIRSFKVKVGRNQDEDFERLLRVRKQIGKCPVYLDANQSFSAEEALRFLRRLERAGIRPVLIEQPVHKKDWEGLKKVTRGTRVTVLADESVSSLADAVRLIRGQYADAINIKLMKFGVFRAREIAVLAQASGVKLMIGSMMESLLAATAAAHLASSLGRFDYVDLDTPLFVRDRIMKKSYLSRDGVYDLRPVRAGIGIVPAA